MAEIQGNGSLREDKIIATLSLGDATLTLEFPRDDDDASEDMVTLVEQCEDGFIAVLEALADAAQAEQEADRGGE